MANSNRNKPNVWLVTGGAGFIGSNFLRHALEATENDANPPLIINLDKLTYAGNLSTVHDLNSYPRYQFLHGDITDAKLLNDLFHSYSGRLTKVIHFAAESHVDRSIDGPEAFLQTNVVGTFRLLETARRHWPKNSELENTHRFLHVSTDEVYGSLELDSPAFHEETPYAPNSPYSASKAASDHLVRAWYHTYHLPTVTTNCSNNYGPYQFPEKLIPLTILNAIHSKPLPIYGDGKNIRDWLYVGDHCEAILRVLKAGRLGETYNIGGRHEKTNIEIVHTLCSVLDRLAPRADQKSYSTQITFVPDRPGHDRRYAIDAAKIERELSWIPAETFESGIEKTVQWYLTHKEWCQQVTEAKYNRERLGLIAA